jgi:hypothetical protein
MSECGGSGGCVPLLEFREDAACISKTRNIGQYNNRSATLTNAVRDFNNQLYVVRLVRCIAWQHCDRPCPLALEFSYHGPLPSSAAITIHIDTEQTSSSSSSSAGWKTVSKCRTSSLRRRVEQLRLRRFCVLSGACRPIRDVLPGFSHSHSLASELAV